MFWIPVSLNLFAYKYKFIDSSNQALTYFRFNTSHIACRDGNTEEDATKSNTHNFRIKLSSDDDIFQNDTWRSKEISMRRTYPLYLPTCNTTINEMLFSMAQYLAPPKSMAWLKTKRILSRAKSFYIPDQMNIFNDTNKNIIKMLEGYGLVRFENETFNTNNCQNDTVLLQYSFYDHDSIPVHCIGDRCKSMPRIIIQTEQLSAMKWAPSYIKACHYSANCVIWDFSQANHKWTQLLNASDSMMIIPHMFHDRLKGYYPASGNDLIPYNSRSLDFVLFGIMTRRRKQFFRRYIVGQKTLSNYNFQFKSVMHENKQVEMYKKSKICLIVHSYLADSGGEFHRLSDLKRFGCLPIVEKFSDDVTVEILSNCSGVVFADFENLTSAVVRELERMSIQDPITLRSEQLSIYNWWGEEIERSSFLGKIFGDKTMVSTATSNTRN